MSSLAIVQQAPVMATVIRVARPVSTRRGRWRKWLAAFIAALILSPVALTPPPVWHGALRDFLTWPAARCGYDLTIGRIPPDDASGLAWIGEGSWWQAAGFSGEVDAKLDDLHSLAELVGPGLADLSGRMSINGRLGAMPGHAGIEGYLNVEGSRPKVRGAPLDYLRSTLLFRGGALEIADVQATHDADYFTAHGSVGLSGEHPDRRGEARVEIGEAGLYAPALAGLPGLGDRVANVRRLDAVIRSENGEVVFDRRDPKQTGILLAR